ncbi:MAG: hypothetical protein ACRDJW_09135 [Thermomicrobiales bacterium]
MDDHRFDDLTRRLADATSRRTLVKSVSSVLLSGVAAHVRRGTAIAQRLPNGSTCTRATQCASLKCVDGVCCNSNCTGQCEACNLAGAVGACTALPASTQQHGARPACTGTGVCQASCDGVTRNYCTHYPGLDIVCADPVCEAGWQTTYGCGGDGTCHPSRTSCGLFVCNPDATGCLTSCQDNTDCVGAAFCANGVCQGDQPLGQPCTDPAQCQSGLCVDGVCCVEVCDNPCQACNVAGNFGFCADIVDGTNCNDGDLCTTGDICRNGNCQGTPVICTTPGVCEASPGTCNLQTGSCSYPDAPDNTSCGANQVCCAGICCVAGETCVNGACQPGTGDICQRCRGASCVPAPDNSFCSITTPNQVCCDGICCDAGEVCVDGDCQPGACLGLDIFCDPNNNLCCQDEPTFCEATSTCHAANPGSDPTCCHRTGGFCTDTCDCCDFQLCRSNQCCRLSQVDCDDDDQCCSGVCCNDVCCNDFQACCNGACQAITDPCVGQVPMGGSCTETDDCIPGGGLICADGGFNVNFGVDCGDVCCTPTLGASCAPNADGSGCRCCGTVGCGCPKSVRCSADNVVCGGLLADCTTDGDCVSGLCDPAGCCHGLGGFCPGGIHVACCGTIGCGSDIDSVCGGPGAPCTDGSQCVSGTCTSGSCG